MHQLTPEQIVQSNYRQLSRIAYKKRQAMEIANAIEQFFDDNDIPLIKFSKSQKKADKVEDYLMNKRFENKEHVIDDPNCVFNPLRLPNGRDEATDVVLEYPEFTEIAKCYYTLKGGNKSIIQKFEDGKGNVGVQLLAHWYSRHKICPVWNMRKSQIVRKKYREFLSSFEAYNDTTERSELLIKTHTPVHMVLTLPHKDGLFEGQRFYARKLLHYFHELRRSKYFKDSIFGGEYGLEIKRSKHNNGLHIHLHSFLFLKNHIEVKEFRAWLKERWEKLTGATFCHFETLYYFKRDEQGEWIMTNNRKKDEYGWHPDVEENQDPLPQGNARMLQAVKVRKKFYIDENSTIEEYTKGVMECIKYHFKMDDYKDAGGSWDVPLIMDILNNSRNLRFYSRFGGFLKIAQLNFNDKKPKAEHDEPELLIDENGELIEDFVQSIDEEVEETVMANSNGVIERSINPFTYEVAKDEDFKICVVKPDRLVFQKNLKGQHSLKFYNEDDFIEVSKLFDLKQIIRAVCSNRLFEVSNCTEVNN